MVEPVNAIVAVKTLLLQEALPELALRPGASVVARVASRGGHHGVLVLGRIPLPAQLPEEGRSGETLRPRVGWGGGPRGGRAGGCWPGGGAGSGPSGPGGGAGGSRGAWGGPRCPRSA